MLGQLSAAAIHRLADRIDWRIEGIDRWRDGGVLICWHGHILLGAALLAHLGRATECWAPIVPEYGQSGSMMAFAERLGLQTIAVPGYEHPRERRAKLETLMPALRAGQSLFMAADGHRPPSYTLRDEPLWLAERAGVPLLPVAFAARPVLTLPTWDRKLLPLPNSHVTALVGETLVHESDPDHIAAQLHALVARAAELGR